jgi:predicted nuclease of predicted toxin-antitoxin system
MRWIADECISAKVVAALRSDGHDVVFIVESHPGMRDADILELSNRERRLLLTEDKDFGELVFTGAPATGVIFIRIADERAHLVWPRLRAAIEQFGESLFGRHLVVEEARFRSRPISSE